MRDESPMLIACAVVADVAAIARRSSAPAPGIVSRVQCSPASDVCNTLPRCPLVHTTRGDTTLSPRSSTSAGLTCATHCACATHGAIASAGASDITNRDKRMIGKRMIDGGARDGWRGVCLSRQCGASCASLGTGSEGDARCRIGAADHYDLGGFSND